MKAATASPTQEALAGLVERVTFHNAENGFCVLRTKARGHRELVTVVGHSATIAAGEWITATGNGSTTAPMPAIQGPGPADLRSDIDRRHRKIPVLWDDPGDRPGLRQEARARLLSTGSKRRPRCGRGCRAWR